MMLLSKTDRARIREHATQATPGPFVIYARSNNAALPRYPVRSEHVGPDGQSPGTDAAFSSRLDAAFFAVARRAVPQLLSDLETLEARRQRPQPCLTNPARKTKRRTRRALRGMARIR